MADKYIYNNAGVLTERALIDTSAGAGDAGKGVALDSTGKLDTTMIPTRICADTNSAPASENLAAGDFVNLWSDGGTLKARKADASTTGKEAHGFVLAAVTSGNSATVYREGTNTQVSGLTVGSKYYLSAATAGGIVTTAPSATGNVIQLIGIANSATQINFTQQDVIVLA